MARNNANQQKQLTFNERKLRALESIATSLEFLSRDERLAYIKEAQEAAQAQQAQADSDGEEE